MEENIRNLLDEEVVRQIQQLDQLESGSKEMTLAVNDVTKLYKLRIDETKIQMDYNDKVDSMNAQADNLNIQVDQNTKDRYLKLIIAGAELLVPLVFYAVWMHQGFKFEETGSIASSTFRGLISRFRPTKK